MGHRHTTQISLQTHYYSFGFSGHPWAQSASRLEKQTGWHHTDSQRELSFFTKEFLSFRY